MSTTATPNTTQPTVQIVGEWDEDAIVNALVWVVVKRVREMGEHDAKRKANCAVPVRVRK